jgi:transcriptional regulator with XRE-family HTH domain
MGVGARLRQLREEKKLSQGDITEAIGLARSYISRVEHEHTVPSIETLHRFAAALGIPLYTIFYKADDALANPRSGCSPDHSAEGADAPEDTRFLLEMGELSCKMDDSERALLLQFARKLAANNRLRRPAPVASNRRATVGARQT